MPQPFRRQPIAALMASQGTEHMQRRVLGAGDPMMPAIGAGIVAAIGTAAAGYRHSTLPGA